MPIAFACCTKCNKSLKAKHKTKMHLITLILLVGVLLVPFCMTHSCSDLPESELMVKLHRKIRNTGSPSDLIPSSTGKHAEPAYRYNQIFFYIYLSVE